MMSSAESTVRDSNIELLRIVLISMILCLHYFKYSGTLHTLKPSDLNYYPSFWLESLFIIAADCFVLITGYYQINEKFKLKKVIELWKQVIFYSVAISLIFWFVGIEPITIHTLLQAFFPVITGTYWFVTTYIVLYLFSPFINTALNSIKKEDHKKLILVLAIFFVILPSLTFTYFTDTGYSLYNFVFLYCVGAYIKKYDLPIKKLTYFLSGYFVCSFIILFGVTFFRMFSETPVIFFSDPWNYNFIFVELAAICLFMVFRQIKIYSEKINVIAASVFGIYLVSAHPFVINVLYSEVLHSADYRYSPLLIPYMLFSGTCIFVSCLLIEFFRRKLFAIIPTYPHKKEEIGFVEDVS
jgi:surface polysaccharide O-acyltransferase-like enzyme